MFRLRYNVIEGVDFMEIGERIRNLRRAKLMTQDQLAKAIGVKRAVISKYENGNVSINISILEKLAAALDVTPSFLIGYEEQIVNPENYTPAALTELNNIAWDLYKQHIEKINSSERKLLYFFSQLNNIGQEKALERVYELTRIQEYTKKE